MPEAVIVAAARSPIGRAFKGSLKDLRPDDLAATIVPGRARPGARARPSRHRRPDAGLRAARRRAGLQHGPGGRRPARPGPPARHHDHPLLRVVAADHPDGPARDQGRRGRRVHLRRRGDGVPVRQGQLRLPPGHPEPGLRRCADQGRAAVAEGGADRWPDPRDDGELPDVVHRRWARPRRTSRLSRASPAQEMDEFAVRSQNLAEKATVDGFWAREITPVTLPDGTVVATDDCPAPGRHPRARRRPEAGVPPRRPGDRRQRLPAQRRRRRPGRS